jgi:hypothetical protein
LSYLLGVLVLGLYLPMIRSVWGGKIDNMKNSVPFQNHSFWNDSPPQYCWKEEYSKSVKTQSLKDSVSPNRTNRPKLGGGVYYSKIS